MNRISAINGLTQELESKPQSLANGRAKFIACDDQGTYYISNAINAATGGVDIRFERNSTGDLQNIYSYSTGFPVAGWDHIGTSVFNPKSEFCIDGVQIYGLDIEGLPLALRMPVSLRVRLRASDCTATITSKYGHC